MPFTSDIEMNIVTGQVPAFEPLTDTAIGYALSGNGNKEQHDACLPLIPALGVLEYRAPNTSLTFQRRHLRVLAWNAERLKYDVGSRALYGSVLPDIALLSEVDIGMARSGNRHTIRDLSEPFDAGYVYAVEFAELGLGDDREIQWHKDQSNTFGYHGNAIVSRFPLHDPFAIRLDEGGHWFVGLESGDQRRIGFRNALAARIGDDTNGVWVVVAHFENRTSPEGRAEQAKRLIDALNKKCGEHPIVIGGDFNTSALPTDPDQMALIYEDPSRLEPMFDILKQAGFTWASSNTPEPTCRTRPDGTPIGPFTKIDWLFTRGLTGSEPATLPAIDADGMALSDHEALRVTVTW